MIMLGKAEVDYKNRNDSAKSGRVGSCGLGNTWHHRNLPQTDPCYHGNRWFLNKKLAKTRLIQEIEPQTFQ